VDFRWNGGKKPQAPQHRDGDVWTRPKVVFFYQTQSFACMLLRAQLTRPQPAHASIEYR
jgi:hypothetical protein